MYCARPKQRFNIRSPRLLRHNTYERLGPWVNSVKQRNKHQAADRLAQDETLSPTELYLESIAHQFPTGEFEHWDRCQQLLPCTIEIYNTVPNTHRSLEAWTDVVTNVAWYCWKRGNEDIAYNMISTAVAVRQKLLGFYHEKTLTSVEILAGVLSSQGCHKEALKLNWRAFRGFLGTLGFNHPFTLTSMNNLALALQRNENHRVSELLCQLTLRKTKKILGPDHPDTLTTMSNLALVSQQRGKHRKAMDLNLRSLEGFKSMLGEQHPSTLTCMTNLASVMQCLGKYEESADLNWQSLEAKIKILGLDHPSTLYSMHTCRTTLQCQGSLAMMEKFW